MSFQQCTLQKTVGVLTNKMKFSFVCIQLQQELQVQQNEISREMRLKDKLDKEVKQLHVDMEAKTGDIKALSLQGQKAKEEQQRLEQQVRELKVSGVNRVGHTHTLFKSYLDLISFPP